MGKERQEKEVKLDKLKEALKALEYLQELPIKRGPKRADVTYPPFSGDLPRERIMARALIKTPVPNHPQHKRKTLLEQVHDKCSVMLMTIDLSLYRRQYLQRRVVVYVCDEAFRVSHAEDASIEVIRPIRRLWL